MPDSQLFRVMRDDRLGRYLVANQNLKKGTRIFTDVPFALGPKADSSPTCLGCHRVWNGTYLCSVCKWPSCNEKCEKLSRHSDYECKVFSEASAIFQEVEDPSKPCLQYDCITPLRLLLSKEKNPERWEKEITAMEDHEADRRIRLTWEVDQVNIIGYLRGPCKLDRFSVELIQRACGILEVNGVEVPSHHGPNNWAIYPRVAIMSHNCVPSVAHVIVSGGKDNIPENFAEIYAATDIEEGGKLEMCYTQGLQSTIQRRSHLKLSKFFDCDCARCADPTELGTHLSTLKCNQCDSGLLLSANPTDRESIWNCTQCNFTTTSSNVYGILSVIDQEINSIEMSGTCSTEVEQKEQAMQWYKGVLHEKHATLIGLKLSLSQLYGRVSNYMLEDLSVALLKRKIKMCRQVLEVLDVISPGQTRLRGITLYELHAPMILVARIEYKDGTITSKHLKERVAMAAEMLHECGEILSREDENSEKGKLGRAAMKSYKDLLATI